MASRWLHNEVKCGRDEAKGIDRHRQASGGECPILFQAQEERRSLKKAMAHTHMRCRRRSVAETGRWLWGELRIEAYGPFVGGKTILYTEQRQTQR